MSGFVQIPRSLYEHPTVIAAPLAQFKALMYLIEGACFAPCQQDDHGKLIDLKPAQIMITQRGFATWIKVKENDVRRAIERFSKVKILMQEVTHKKTIITITHQDTYERFLSYSDARSDAKVTQERRKSDAEKEKIENIEKERKTKKINKEENKTRIREWVLLSQEEIDKIFHLHGDKLANQMLDILDANNTKRQEHYKSDYGALKMGGWVYQAALSRNAPKTPYNSKSVDRRTCDINGVPILSAHDGRF